jgi:ABC-type nitrate/sulfonate/bicarbonate transport system substrate-binding protein
LLSACGSSSKAASSDSTSAVSAESAEAATGGTTAGETVIIHIANPATAWNIAFDVAYQEGFLQEAFADQNVEFELIETGGPAATDALLSGTIDIVVGLGDQPLISALQGKQTDIRILATSVISPNNGIVVAADSDITSVEDLAGKAISVGVGSAAHKILLYQLAEHGLSADDVEITNISAATEAVAALASGDLDAIFVDGANFVQAEEKGFGKVLEQSPYYSYNFYVTSGTFYDEHEDWVVLFLQALEQGYEFFLENEEQSYQDIADLLGLELSDIQVATQNADVSVGLSDDAIQDLYNTNQFIVDQGLGSVLLTEDEINAQISDLVNTIG